MHSCLKKRIDTLQNVKFTKISNNDIMFSARKLMQCDMWNTIILLELKGFVLWSEWYYALNCDNADWTILHVFPLYIFGDLTNGFKWPTICRKTSRHFYNDNALHSHATWTPSAGSMLMDSYRLNVNWLAWHNQRPISIWIKVMVLHKGAHTIKNTVSSPICPRPWCENAERTWHFGECAPLTAMWGNLRVILKR